MKLPADQCARCRSCSTRRCCCPKPSGSWVELLGPEHAAVKPLLAGSFARPSGVETADLVGTLPSFAPPRAETGWAAGAIVGPYRLIRELGRGRMSAVWLAAGADGPIK